MIVLSILSLVLAYNTFKLTIVIISFSQGQFSTFVIVISAFAYNLLITGSIAFLGFVYPTHKLLPNGYYKIKNKRRLKKIHSLMGVNIFQFFLLKTFYRSSNNKKYFNGTKAGINEFEYNTRQSEFGHLISFILVELLSVILFFYGHSLIFLWIQPMNILLNFYPIILQRTHRIKTEKIFAMINKE